VTLATRRQVQIGAAVLGVKSDEKSNRLSEARQQALIDWAKHPWNFLTGVDPDTGEPIYRTRDERDDRNPIKPFPKKDYLKRLVDDLRQDEPRFVEVDGVRAEVADVLFLVKSRQMICTTSVMGVCLWEMLFRPARRIILSKVTEDDAKEILQDKLRAPWSHLPGWVQKELPLDDQPAGKASALHTGSYCLAVAENAAYRECRGGTASRLVIDEAAFQDYCQEIVEAAQPMAKRITIITTPMANSPGGNFVRQMIFDENE
jgi:hypothetical protein